MNNLYFLISDKIYGNVGLHVGDDVDSVIKNRKSVAKSLDIDLNRFIFANQTHGDNIKIVNEKDIGSGVYDYENSIKDCDSLITNSKDIIIAVLVADCVPIMLYDKANSVVCAIHAGWRGTNLEITKKSAIKMMEVFGTKLEDIEAFIAPAICKNCYEVSFDVAKLFKNYIFRDGKYFLDLKEENRLQLIEIGVKNIEVSHICNCCDINYFSHRRDIKSGRFGLFVGVKNGR